MVKIATISGYKPYELGIFKQDHPAILYIKRAIKEQLIVLLDEGLEVGHAISGSTWYRVMGSRIGL